MAVKESFTCDICGAGRKETNHWFAAQTSGYGFRLWTWGGAQEVEMLNASTMAHLCGQACVHKFIDKWLSNPGG